MKTDNKQYEIRKIVRICFGIDPNTISTEFMYKLYYLTSITSVYEIVPNSSESIINYINKVKDLVTSDEYAKLSAYSKTKNVLYHIIIKYIVQYDLIQIMSMYRHS